MPKNPMGMMRGTLGKQLSSGRASQRRLAPRESQHTNFTNNSGETLVPGDVVIIDLANDTSVVLTDPGDTLRVPLVVMAGAVDGDIVKCYTPGYNIVVVTCDAAAISRGDALVASGTQRQATPSGAPALLTTLGVAVTEKAGGAAGHVSVLLLSR